MNHSEHTNTDQTRQLYPRIVSKPSILYGKPVIEGTRLSVEVVLQNLASGYTRDDLLDAYPFLKPEDITAAIEYAARLAANPPGSSIAFICQPEGDGRPPSLPSWFHRCVTSPFMRDVMPAQQDAHSSASFARS